MVPVDFNWMSFTSLRALAVAAVLGLLLGVAATVLAATPKTCGELHGRDIAASATIRVVRLKLPRTSPRGPSPGIEQRTGLFACKLPNGPVDRLATDGRSYFHGQEKAPVESATVKIGTSAGQFATVIETDSTLIGETFLTERVVNAATGQRLYAYLKISGSTVPSLGAPLRTLLSPTGTLVGLFPSIDAAGMESTNRLIVFTGPRGQVLDTAAGGGIPPASIALAGNTVTWTDAGTARSATIAAG
jgi:hypothetical protein